MMSFLTVVVTSRYPTTNNQLRTSSNPRQQATIYDGKVTVQPVHGRQTTYAAGTTRKYTPGASGSNTGKQRMETVTTPKGRVIFPSSVLCPREKRMKRDPRLLDTQTSHTVITHNVAYQADDWMPMTLMGDELSQPRLLSWPNLSWMAQMHSLRCRYIKKRLKIERNANVDKVFLDHEQYAEMNVPTMYQAPAENSLLEKTGDMRTFMNWYCQNMGKTEHTQADFEVQAYEVVKPFYPDVVHLQFQMEECNNMLTDQIDWTNPEGDQVRIDISRPLPLSGPPVVFPVSNNKRKIMRFNEIYKFSDGTLTNIMEALDYIVKEYKVNRLNPGMNTRFWTDKDVERSKEFIHAIKRRLKTRRIFQNLECFIGGRVRDIDYRLLQRTE
ncbi:hypothetical protein Tco_1215741 [Tanacetum coccineum]